MEVAGQTNGFGIVPDFDILEEEDKEVRNTDSTEADSRTARKSLGARSRKKWLVCGLNWKRWLPTLNRLSV